MGTQHHGKLRPARYTLTSDTSHWGCSCQGGLLMKITGTRKWGGCKTRGDSVVLQTGAERSPHSRRQKSSMRRKPHPHKSVRRFLSVLVFQMQLLENNYLVGKKRHMPLIQTKFFLKNVIFLFFYMPMINDWPNHQARLNNPET